MFSNKRKHFNYIILLGTIFLFMVVSLLYEVFLMCENNKETTLYNLELESNTITNEINCYIDKSVDMINAIDNELTTTNNVYTAMENVNKQLGTLDNGISVNNIMICDGRNCQYLLEQESATIPSGVEWAWFNNAPKVVENDPYISRYKDEKFGEEYIVVSKRIQVGNRVVGICFNLSVIKELVNSIKRENAYILDMEGKVLACKNISEEGKNLFKENRVLSKSANVNIESQDTIQQFRNGKDKYIITVRNVEAGLKYVTYSLYNTVYIREYKVFYVNIIIIILIVVFVGLVFVKSYIYRKEITNLYHDRCEFIKALTKELKVPVEAIKSKSNLIRNDKDIESIAQSAFNINEDSNAIGFMLNCVYDYSQIAAGELQIDEVEYDINSIKKHLKSFVKCDVKRKNIYFDVEDEVDPTLRFIGDQKLLEEAIINMIKVSAEWTIQGGIDVKIKYFDLGDRMANLIFVIQDTSSGMSEEDLVELEEKINSVNERIKADEVGIGVELSKRLVSLLNGRIKIETAKNIGNIFTIVIPQKISMNKNTVEEAREVEEVEEETVLEMINENNIYSEQEFAKNEGDTEEQTFMNEGDNENQAFVNEEYTEEQTFMNEEYSEEQTFMNEEYSEEQTFTNEGHTEEQTSMNIKSPYEADQINSLEIRTLQINNEEDKVNSEKKERLKKCLESDGFDLEKGLANTKYDIEVYENVIKNFYQLSHKNVKEAVALWNKKDFGGFIDLIGSIKASVIGVGAEKLYKMILDIEEHAQNKDLVYVVGKVKEFFDEWKRVLRNIALYFKG